MIARKQSLIGCFDAQNAFRYTDDSLSLRLLILLIDGLPTRLSGSDEWHPRTTRRSERIFEKCYAMALRRLRLDR